MSTRVADYQFDLPEELIATRPLERRSDSRLLVLRAGQSAEHRQFVELPELLREGDRLVLNDTRVIPARLTAEKAGSGGRVEVLLCRPHDEGGHVVLLNPGRRMKPGTRLVFGGEEGGFDEPFFGTVGERMPDEPGAWRMTFEGDPVRYAAFKGRVPLPPYMKRDDDDEDLERYQTVYANPDKPGSAAAPTAGLHFTEAILDELGARGVGLSRVTLHVGPGTFLPVRTDDVREHKMHPEPWELSAETAAELNATREAGGRIIPVGTTALRVLETAVRDDGRFFAGSGLTRLFLRPGTPLRATDALVTNFHLPGSTLLMLVAALVGRRRILAAYEEAVRERYRFFSYGDVSFLEKDEAGAVEE